MKIIGIVCSPRKGGNTEIAVREALEGAKERGANIELILVSGKKIAPCENCDYCKQKKTLCQCKIKDDMQEIYTKLSEADGIIFGTPVYFWSMSAQAKAIMDRTHAITTPGFRHFTNWPLRGKVGGVVVVTRRAGATSTFHQVSDFFRHHRIIEAGGAILHGGEIGEVRQDDWGMQEARNLGRAVVKAIKRRTLPLVSDAQDLLAQECSPEISDALKNN